MWRYIQSFLSLFVYASILSSAPNRYTAVAAATFDEDDPPDSHTDFPRYKAEHLRFHGDDTCDREAYNDYKRKLKRKLRKRALSVLAADASIHDFPPTEQTLSCPTTTTTTDLPDWSVPEIGLDTTWLVVNKSSQSVVISLVDYDKDGMEVSPFTPNMEEDPNQVDPQAVLQPGEFKAVSAFEGQVFRLRPLLSDGKTKGSNVLLQYRAGIRSIAVASSLTAGDCPAEDVEPPRDDSNFDRTTPKKNLKCHSIETGFRNMSPCPLNAYFAHNGTESYRFHLGTDASIPGIMTEAWTSAVKFETSYIPHAYVFRNAQTGDFVQRYTLQPTRVTDCEEEVEILPSGQVV